MQQISTEPIHIIMPKAHLGALVAGYLYKIEAIAQDQQITSMNIPVDVDENGNIEITVGVLKESIN